MAWEPSGCPPIWCMVQPMCPQFCGLRSVELPLGVEHKARHTNNTEPCAVTRVSCDTVFGEALAPERNEDAMVCQERQQ